MGGWMVLVRAALQIFKHENKKELTENKEHINP
jgi:hypothetical protein